MIIAEKILQEGFTQLPPYIDGNSVSFPIRFGWGSQDGLNLWLSQQKQNTKYPLIWLVESKTTIESITEEKALRDVRLIIAKESSHKTNTNPIIWDSEYKDILEPITNNVITFFKKSGVTDFVGGYEFEFKANYYENQRRKDDKVETKNFTIDCWNVVIFDAKIKFNGSKCINNEIKF